MRKALLSLAIGHGPSDFGTGGDGLYRASLPRSYLDRGGGKRIFDRILRSPLCPVKLSDPASRQGWRIIWPPAIALTEHS